MVDLDTAIVGQEDIIAHLQQSIRADKVSHAYLFGGERGLGKGRLAAAFAQTLQCQEKGVRPCGVCPSCKKMSSGNHPDIRFVSHEKPASISVEEIREQVVNDIVIRPYESRFKIYIIDDADKMTPQAQNALLKSVEEPPAYGILMLLADNPEVLLPTILSRCVRLNLKPVSDDKIRDYLMRHLQIPDYQADIQAAFAQGNAGRAARIARSPEFMELVAGAVRLMKRSRQMEASEMIEALRRMASDKQSIYDELDVFEMWFRDVLMFKATREVDSLVFRDEIRAITERAETSSYEGLQKILKALQTAAARLRANVNFELTMELLFLTIREN